MASSSTKSDLENLAEDLKGLRDELELKMHLAGADLRDEWQDLEKKWQRFSGRMDSIGQVAEDAAGDVGDALDLVGDEIKKSYERIRKML